jgi:sigma-B regulation protein RsbU (phosphoserine phosphatase)
LLTFAAAQSPASASGMVKAMQSLLESLGAGVQDDVAVLALGVPTG